ncbi:MAG TPA: hypothetical protein VK437_13830 [Steroidobacteraceae bacterium]|nr:hypothetical protein [Steroidobacteraceae bacterium]
MRKILLSTVLAGIAGIAASWPAAAEDSLLRVLVVQTADEAAYVKEVQNLQALLAKNGQQTKLRVWRATLAGADTGAVVVTIEMANLAALAKTLELERTNPELAAELKKLNAIRKVTSDSVYDLISH